MKDAGVNINGLLAILLIVLFTNCKKEYSFENGGAQVSTRDTVIVKDTSKPKDTIPNDGPVKFPQCPSCFETSEPELNNWSFTAENTLLCGSTDTAIMTFERTAFTFFGPSACASDTGLIFTVFLSPSTLNHDTTNFEVPYAAFYYYHTGFPNILINRINESFKLIITKYVHSTRIATGIFSGVGYTQENKAVQVTNGKFKIKLL